MTAFENASQFFHACESLHGWEGCRKFAASNASFRAQSEPLADIKTVEAYCDWMAGLGKGPLAGCSYQLHNAAFDEESNTAIFFATFTGTHVGDGGPIAPTQKQTNSEYVYVLKMNENNLVESMCKIWNAPWALNELGWG